MKEYKFKWNDNKACRDRGCFGSRDTTEELTFPAYGKKDAIVKAMNIVSAKCIFTEWDEEFLENADNLSLQELREYLHSMDIGGGAAFIYWVVEVESDESVFESGYEEDDDEDDDDWSREFDAGCEDEYFDDEEYWDDCYVDEFEDSCNIED